MPRTERELQWFIHLWNVRLHLAHHIEVVCPKCKGCASPYFVASLVQRWGLEDVEALASRLPFSTKIEKLPEKNGFKISSFPGEPDPHPDIFSNNHSGEKEHTMPIVTQCQDCHGRAAFGNQVTPTDLYWRVQTRHGMLWAYSREWLVKVRNIIEGDSRPRGPLTSRLPAAMMKASNRSEMIKLIDRVLLKGPSQ